MSAPRRGSMAYYPRVRARSIRVRVKSWPILAEETRLLGFPAYKAFAAQVALIDTTEKSPLFGKEVIKACTVLECPDIFVLGLKFYTYENGRLASLLTIYSQNYPDKISKYLGKIAKSRYTINDLQNYINKICEVRALVATQPYLTTIGKKRPEIFELKISGNINEAIEYGKNLLGKFVSVDEIFKDLQLVDIIGVTKGKGFQGVVKRFGVKILPRWHKHRKGSRKIGSIGPIEPSLMRYVPRPGKMGFHRRTEYNKQILKIGDDLTIINPKGGIKHYGLIRNKYIIIAGSVMGPPKRIIFLRFPIRPRKRVKSYKFEKILL